MPDQSDTPVPAKASFGFSDVGADEKQGLVNRIFARVADRYDVMNDLMSGGLHRLWKGAMVSWLAPPKGKTPFHVLDVAGGTGDIARRVIRAGGSGTRVTLADISPEMIEAGKRKSLDTRLRYIQGHAESLPFPDRSFDAYTIAFGIRNVTHLDRALDEAYRVLKPGGRFLCLEFSTVETPWLDTLYDAYSFNAIPALGRLVAGDPDSYRYLVESIRRFPDQENFLQAIRKAGFDRVAHRNLSGGIAALHSGWRL